MRRIINLRDKKGSVTVFILVIMLFILTTLAIGYLNVKNKNISQEEEIEKIRNEYRTNDEEMEQQYEELTQD